ncbi:hypothetical protein T10_11288, partial [Trichinella papuae]
LTLFILVNAGCPTKREVRPELFLGDRQVADVPAGWWSHLGKPGLLRLAVQWFPWHDTASSGRSVSPVCGASAHGVVRGTSAAPSLLLPGTAPPSHGRASLFVASPATRGRSGRSVTPWRDGRAGIFVDVAASSDGPSPARAHGRCALRSRGFSPVALGLRAQAGS